MANNQTQSQEFIPSSRLVEELKRLQQLRQSIHQDESAFQTISAEEFFNLQTELGERVSMILTLLQLQ